MNEKWEKLKKVIKKENQKVQADPDLNRHDKCIHGIVCAFILEKMEELENE